MQKIKQDINIGSNIQRLRKRANLTQEQTIAKMQIAGFYTSRASYAKIEMGITNIRVSELLLLTQIFNARIEEFFEGLSIFWNYHLY